MKIELKYAEIQKPSNLVRTLLLGFCRLCISFTFILRLNAYETYIMLFKLLTMLSLCFYSPAIAHKEFE